MAHTDLLRASEIILALAVPGFVRSRTLKTAKNDWKIVPISWIAGRIMGGW